MTFYNGLIGLFWIIFILVWFISSLSVKKTARNPGLGMQGWFTWRVVFVVIVYFLVRANVFRYLAPYDAAVEGNPAIHLIGVILCGLGILFAFWARYYLGRNWGTPMTLKEDPELVVGGPYRFVRHPIYAGILCAMLGSVLASSLLWLLVLVCAGYYFVQSARQEEKLMQKEFPDTYPAYKKRTKMLVPFVL